MRLFPAFLLFLPLTAPAQQFNTAVAKDIIILRSTKSYPAALQTAREATKKLRKRLDLGDNYPNKELGLSMKAADCQGNGYDYPCYNARGNGAAENSDYISIEYSTAYEALSPGYYIVVAGVAAPGALSTRAKVATVRKYYPDAYAKRTKVWYGCMH